MDHNRSLQHDLVCRIQQAPRWALDLTAIIYVLACRPFLPVLASRCRSAYSRLRSFVAETRNLSSLLSSYLQLSHFLNIIHWIIRDFGVQLTFVFTFKESKVFEILLTFPCACTFWKMGGGNFQEALVGTSTPESRVLIIMTGMKRCPIYCTLANL